MKNLHYLESGLDTSAILALRLLHGISSPIGTTYDRLLRTLAKDSPEILSQLRPEHVLQFLARHLNLTGPHYLVIALDEVSHLFCVFTFSRQQEQRILNSCNFFSTSLETGCMGVMRLIACKNTNVDVQVYGKVLGMSA